MSESFATVPAVERIAREVARPAADDVDKAGRFPSESVKALREAKLMSAAIATELGGGGASILELAAGCTALAQHCASSGMVLAMHHIQALCLNDHRGDSQDLARYLGSVVSEQRLIASVTSEVGPSGDLRRSDAPVEASGNAFTLTKQATTVSYGAHADDLLITARRNKEAQPTDQVLVLSLRGAHTLSKPGTWDSLGMRGTCSPGATVSTRGESWQVMHERFSRIASCTMVPASHVLWASCWLGIAQDAVGKAQAMVRAQARSAPSATPRAATRLPELARKLQLLRDEVNSVASHYDALRRANDVEHLESVSFALRINNLKLTASRMTVEIVGEALVSCGIAAYKNDSPYSLGRQLRDAYSALLMIHNDRIAETNASLLLIHKGG